MSGVGSGRSKERVPDREISPPHLEAIERNLVEPKELGADWAAVGQRSGNAY
jgi:hypothetical protein